MLLFGKTYSYWKELYRGFIFGLIIALIVFFLNPQFSKWKDFIKEFPTIGTCAFGFLLTFLSIILQGGSETIIWMKKRKVLFERFISFNKRIVIISIFLSIYAYVLGFFNFEFLMDLFELKAQSIILIQKVLISVFSWLGVWFVIDTLHFIHIFYLLLKKEK